MLSHTKLVNTKPGTRIKKDPGTRHQWLMLTILATRKAEIRRIMVQSQPWENSSPDPISKIPITKRVGRVTQA
jgi:hypothetical protein